MQVDDLCKEMIRTVRNYCEALSQGALFFQHLEDVVQEKDEKTVHRKKADLFDQTLGILGRIINSEMRRRAQKTNDTEILWEIYGNTLADMQRFPDLWRKLITTEADADSSESPGYWFLESLSSLTQFFEKECERRPSLFKFWAKEHPFLPMLVLRNKAAYAKRFDRMADMLELGVSSPIHVSERANYNLETPINAKVFEVLMEFSAARGWLHFVREGDPEKDWRKGASKEDQLAEQASIPKHLHAVYWAADELPELTKATAQSWADTLVMPFFDALKSDYRNDTSFGTASKRGRVKSMATARAEVRKDVIRSLKGMARPIAPNSSHS